ncbi:MAG: FHA domain-containing protein [Planctomycetaceae bacterium]
MVAVLQQVGGGRIIAIDRAVVLVGRGADCDAVITASQKISRRHCCLVQVDNSYYLRDLGSMNGVWLNGERVNREIRMNLGDRVAIGDVEFLFHPNARIEQKKKPAAPPSNGSATAGKSPPQLPQPRQAAQPPIKEDSFVDADQVEVVESDHDAFEIIDDVIPLEDLDIEMVGTNEIEVIDEPLLDEDDPTQ